MGIFITKITKNNNYAVIDNTKNQYIARIFENEKTYNNWKLETTKNGHSITTFYKIKSMIQKYSKWTQSEINEL